MNFKFSYGVMRVDIKCFSDLDIHLFEAKNKVELALKDETIAMKDYSLIKSAIFFLKKSLSNDVITAL